MTGEERERRKAIAFRDVDLSHTIEAMSRAIAKLDHWRVGEEDEKERTGT